MELGLSWVAVVGALGLLGGALGALPAASTGAVSTDAPAAAAQENSRAAWPTLDGVVQSGARGQADPLGGVRVSLMRATAKGAKVYATARTDSRGRFTVAPKSKPPKGVYYLSAAVAPRVDLVTLLGSQLPAEATVNELTTVAAAYSLAQFTHGGEFSGDPKALKIADGMARNVASPFTGAVGKVLRTSPNADETISLRLTRSLANVVSATVASRAAAETFLDETRRYGRRPGNVVQALANLARIPSQNVDEIHDLSRLSRPFTPGLGRTPTGWTIAVKVNDSGDDDTLWGGPGNIAFDKRGYAWSTNNVVQGTPYSATSVVVLKPDGSPADGSGNSPKSPVVGGGILGTGFGVTVGANGRVWFGNYGWGGSDYQPAPGQSITRYTPSGVPVGGFAQAPGVDRGQGMATDADGNVWVTSYGNNKVFVFPKGDIGAGVGHEFYPGSQPFDVAVAPDGAAYVSLSGGLFGTFKSSVARLTFDGVSLHEDFVVPVGTALKGLDVDSRGVAWVASLGKGDVDSGVYGVRPDGSLIGPFAAGGVYGPWDVTIDGHDILWVSNFGHVEVNNKLPYGRVSALCGLSTRHCGGAETGDPLTPDTGLTMPSAGSQVLLADGTPLYGKGAKPSFSPMMRQTAQQIDAAGNLWTINNWKPPFDLDAFKSPINDEGNPGGDGIVIFLGLAVPS
jgi:hypothetical protein